MLNSTRHSHPAETTSRASYPQHIFRRFVLLGFLASCFLTIHGQNAGVDEARESSKALKLWGTPGTVQMVDGPQSVKLHVSVNVIAENTGKENLLLLKRTPASTSEEIVSLANPATPLWRQQHESAGKSNSDPALSQLRKTLDQNDPPDDDVINLGPGDSIGWNVSTQLDVAKGAGPDKWEAIRKACPCALKLDMDLWPLSLEPSGDRADSGFGRKMTKRWHKKGLLVFTDKQTDPIEVKLPDK